VAGAQNKTSKTSEPKKIVTPAAPNKAAPRPDDRVLIRLRSDASTWDLPLYTIRCMVQDALGLKTGDIAAAQAIHTGLALKPRNLEIRDRLLAEAPKLLDLLQATKVERPQKWVSYVLQGCPRRVATGLGVWVDLDAQLVNDEVRIQAKQEPVDCRPSRHQTDGPDVTWIVSFAQPVKVPFKLFDASQPARLLVKKSPPIQCKKCWEHHDERGCKRRPICVECAELSHEGQRCMGDVRCALCRGPHPATDPSCPVRPVRKNGEYVQLSKRQRAAAKEAGERAFQAGKQAAQQARERIQEDARLRGDTEEPETAGDPMEDSSPTQDSITVAQ
jgi:hypothetical protein